MDVGGSKSSDPNTRCSLFEHTMTTGKPISPHVDVFATSDAFSQRDRSSGLSAHSDSQDPGGRRGYPSRPPSPVSVAVGWFRHSDANPGCPRSSPITPRDAGSV
jgi:hypothetical protein